MGCWNISFWDNDECVGFLVALFEHMALLPYPKVSASNVLVITNEVYGSRLLARYEVPEYESIQRLFMSITAATLEKAKQADPKFKEKLFRDVPEEGLERIGLTKQRMWTLIHMHVGAPIDQKDLDDLAQAFHVGGTWIIDPYLKTLQADSMPGVSDRFLEETRNQHAPVIRQGIIKYKERIEKGELLEPMKLAFFGPIASQTMWFEGKLPAALPPQAVWDTAYIASLAEFPGPDLTIDEPKCSACKALQQGRETPLRKCPCGTVLYCNKDCQKKDWKNHGGLHKVRMDNVKPARDKTAE